MSLKRNLQIEFNNSQKKIPFEFDKFQCIAFEPITKSIKELYTFIVYIPDRDIYLFGKYTKKALREKNSESYIGFKFKGEELEYVFLEFFNEGAVKLECLTTTESELKKTINLIEYKLCQN